MIRPVQLFVLIFLLINISVFSEIPDVVIGKIERDLRWGDRTAVFDVTNNSEELKFLTVEIEIEFVDSNPKPNRRTIQYVVLPAGETRTVTGRMFIPGNYGLAKGQIRIYDVVDTLDILLPGQKFFEDNFQINFHPPEEIEPYLAVTLTLPPRVDEHPDFDSHLSRLMLVLLNEGKSVEEIADMTGAALDYVQSIYENLENNRYISTEEEGRAKLRFPLISVAMAEAGKQMAEQVSDSLVATIKNNLGNYDRVLDSMIAVGAMSTDSNSFLNGGSVLYFKYPVISALYLWWDRGQSFITRSAPLLIYDATDPCNARIPNYMYAVLGGAYFNGTNYYDRFANVPRFGMSYGDSLPVLKCEENYILRGQQGKPVRFTFANESKQEIFVVDTSLARAAVNALKGDTDSLLVETYFRLRDLATSHGHAKATYGLRYWFWNLTASRTLVKLIEQGVVERRGNGQYKFESFRY